MGLQRLLQGLELPPELSWAGAVQGAGWARAGQALLGEAAPSGVQVLGKDLGISAPLGSAPGHPSAGWEQGLTAQAPGLQPCSAQAMLGGEGLPEVGISWQLPSGREQWGTETRGSLTIKPWRLGGGRGLGLPLHTGPCPLLPQLSHKP